MRPIMIPSQAVSLAGGLRCVPREVQLAAWQAHIVKHPLGVDAVRQGAAWNREAWDSTRPAVVTAEQRAELTSGIQALGDATSRCGVRELRGGRTPAAPKEPCYVCEPPLLAQCAGLLDGAGVGPRYAAATEALLRELAADRALEVPRPELSRRLIARLRHPAWIEAGLVLAVGLEHRQALVRIAKGDGTRSDFWLNGVNLAWRTTYRVPVTTVNTRWSFLLEHPAPTPSLPLSDVYVVPRGWWEAHVP